MSRARDLAKLGNTDVIAVNGTDVGFGTRDPKEKVNVVGVVSATSFFGDGSGLDGIASAGIGTALSDDKTKALNTIYYTNNEVLVSNNSVVNPPDSGHIAYTQAPTIVIEDTKEITVADGDDLLVDVLGISTGTNVDYAARGNGVFGNIYVDNIYNQSGQTSVNFPKGIVSSGITTITDGTQSTSTLTGALQVRGGVGIAKSVYIGGNLSVGGTITYEDVTNVDSVGLITARSGIRVTGGDVGIGIDNPDSLLHISKGTNSDDGAVAFTIGGTAVNTRQSTITKNNVGSNNRPLEIRAATGASHETIKFFSDATTERLRIGQSGQFGIGGANYGTSGQVMTSQGASAAPQWADAGGGAWEVVSTHVLSGSTSIITDNGWSNAYARYMMVYDDVYYGGTDFRVVFRVFQDATSGNAGTLLTGNHYLAGGSRAETWSSSENYYTNTGVSYRLGTGATNCPYWTGHMYFSMQTDPATNRQGWYGQTFAGGNAYAYDAGLLSSLTQATHLTGVRLYFVTNTGDADSGNAVNPTQGRVTFLRMKYS